MRINVKHTILTSCVVANIKDDLSSYGYRVMWAFFFNNLYSQNISIRISIIDPMYVVNDHNSQLTITGYDYEILSLITGLYFNMETT